MIRNRSTPEGHELGFHLARFADSAEPKARLKVPELPPRCASCAFRAGPHFASGSPETQMDALKCALEGVPFLCHDVHRDDDVCSGWAMLMLADDRDEFRKAPWGWAQHPDEQEPATPPAPRHEDGRDG